MAGCPLRKPFPAKPLGALRRFRRTLLLKGFLSRQERLLKGLREAGCSPAMICALRLCEVATQDGPIMIRQPGSEPVECGSAATLQRYLERRAELALDCSPAAPLIVDLEGKPLSAEQLQLHYEAARTVRVALEANGSFCRALLSLHRINAAGPSGPASMGGRYVQS